MVNITSLDSSTYLAELPNLVTKDLATNLLNLGAYVLAMVLYAVVVWHFYRYLARREIFPINFRRPEGGFSAFLKKVWDFVTFLLKTLIIFPFIITLWFLILGGFLLFLSKSQDVPQILLMSMTVIAAARVTAYYNEDLSKDLSKLVPFALLGVFIVDNSYFSFASAIEKFYTLPLHLHIIIQYIIAIVLLEFIFSIIYRIRNIGKEETTQSDTQEKNS